jgi:hypothetical protein
MARKIPLGRTAEERKSRCSCVSGLRFFNRSGSGLDVCGSASAAMESGLAKERATGLAVSLYADRAMHLVDCMIATSDGVGLRRRMFEKAIMPLKRGRSMN